MLRLSTFARHSTDILDKMIKPNIKFLSKCLRKSSSSYGD